MRKYASKIRLLVSTIITLCMFCNVTPAFVTNQDASVAIGQVNFKLWVRGCSDSTFESPFDISWDGTRLFIVDEGNDNHRVLIYNGIPTQNNAHADIVVGQVNLNANAGGGVCWWPSDSTLCSPFGVCSDGERLYIADCYNNRVLVYNKIPTENNAHADVVIGQPDMNSYSAGCSDSTLDFPIHVYSDGNRVFISDYCNNRILIYNEILNENNAHADVVLGQVDMNSRIHVCSDSNLSLPCGVYSDGTRLYVSDCGNNRVLIYNKIPTANNARADLVIGQTNMDSSTVPPASDSTLLHPSSVWADTLSNRLFVSDLFGSRVLVFDPIPTGNNANASVVLGQPDMESWRQNQGGDPSANTLSYSRSVQYASGKLFVVDGPNARCLIYEDTLIGREEEEYIGEETVEMSLVPNPSNGNVLIRYFVPFQAVTRIEILDMAGRIIRVLKDPEEKGWRSIVWDRKNSRRDTVPCGIYFCRVKVGNTRIVKKVAVLSTQ